MNFVGKFGVSMGVIAFLAGGVNKTCSATLTREATEYLKQPQLVKPLVQLAQYNIHPDIFSRSNKVFNRQVLTSERLCK